MRPNKLKIMFLTFLLLCSMILVCVTQASAAKPMTQGSFIILMVRMLGYEKEISFLSRLTGNVGAYIKLLQLKGILPPTLANSIMANPQAPLTAGVMAVILAKALKLDIAERFYDPTPEQYLIYILTLRAMDIPIPAEPNASMTRGDMARAVNTPSILYTIAEMYKVPASPVAPS